MSISILFPINGKRYPCEQLDGKKSAGSRGKGEEQSKRSEQMVKRLNEERERERGKGQKSDHRRRQNIKFRFLGGRDGEWGTGGNAPGSSSRSVVSVHVGYG